MSKPFHGVWTAIVTPFASDDSIDWPAFEKLLEMQKNAQVAGVVISGTTGEAPTLTVQEKLSLVRKARAFLPKTIRVMAGSGGNNTEQSVELSRLCEDAGADSLLIVTPPYNKPSPAGLKAHFDAIAKVVSVPLCLYHVPGRTAQMLSAETIQFICSNPKVLAVKEASANLELFSKARQLTGAAFLSGDDGTYLPSLSVGGVGVISVLTNVFPKSFVVLTEAFSRGDHAKALKIHDALLGFIQMLFVETNPCPVKAALARMGVCKNHLRLPLVPIGKENETKLFAALEKTTQELKVLECL